MITYNVALNLIFSYKSISQPVYIYVPFFVNEIIVVDSVYGDNTWESTSIEYTIQSQLFDNTVAPLTFFDYSHYGICYGKHDSFSVKFVNRQSINGYYTFQINSLTTGGVVDDYNILLQFVNYE